MLIVLIAGSLWTAACGSGADVQEPASTSAGATQDAAGGATTIRLAISPDPLWQWLVDSGTLADWQAEHGLRIEVSHPFRPFTALVSGDADIILVNAFDLPVFAHDLDLNPVIVGRYASDRSIAVARRTSRAADLAGVVEGQVAVTGQFGSTLLWSLIVDRLHALDFSADGNDFDMMLTTSGAADTVERGDADACICLPDASIESLRTAMLRPLYDGKPAGQIYAELVGEPDHWSLAEVFATERDWYEAHLSAVADFLAMWDTAMRHWHLHYPELVAAYPELLAVQTQEQVDWLTHYLSEKNWIAPSAYLTAEDSWRYTDAVTDLRMRGLVPDDLSVPLVITNQAGKHHHPDHSDHSESDHSEGGG